jgi:hypothetical protein
MTWVNGDEKERRDEKDNSDKMKSKKVNGLSRFEVGGTVCFLADAFEPFLVPRTVFTFLGDHRPAANWCVGGYLVSCHKVFIFSLYSKYFHSPSDSPPQTHPTP